MMTQGNRKRIGGIEIFRIQFHLQCLLYHQGDLFLGSSTIAAYCDLGLSWCIFSHWYPFHNGSCKRGTLGTAKFQYDLGILAVERRLHRKLIGMMLLDQFRHSRKDIGQFFKGILDLAEVEDSHIDIMGAFGVNGNDPEA